MVVRVRIIITSRNVTTTLSYCGGGHRAIGCSYSGQERHFLSASARDLLAKRRELVNFRSHGILFYPSFSLEKDASFLLCHASNSASSGDSAAP